MNVQDPWYSTPVNEFEDLTWKKLSNIDEKFIKKGLQWSLQEICKPYNTSAAMFSWIPSFTNDNIVPKESYFCSEFTAMVLIHMAYLKPMSVTDCTPNSLKIINTRETARKYERRRRASRNICRYKFVRRRRRLISIICNFYRRAQNI